MEDGEIGFGPFRLDLGRRELRRGDAPVRLGSRAMGILCALVAANGQVVSKDALMERVWAGVIVEDNAIQVHVSALRKALETAGDSPDYIITVPGRGYRFIGLDVAAPAGDHPPGPTLPDRPSIAVLPFDNLSDDSEQDYFADGLVEDIITALSRLKWFFVIARNSSFAFRGRRSTSGGSARSSACNTYSKAAYVAMAVASASPAKWSTRLPAIMSGSIASTATSRTSSTCRTSSPRGSPARSNRA